MLLLLVLGDASGNKTGDGCRTGSGKSLLLFLLALFLCLLLRRVHPLLFFLLLSLRVFLLPQNVSEESGGKVLLVFGLVFGEPHPLPLGR